MIASKPMRFIDERRFLEEMSSFGLDLSEDKRYLRFRNDDAAMGFDFTNLAMPGSEDDVFDSANAREGGVEVVMARTALEMMRSAGLFPIYLFASDNEWLDEDPEPLLKQGLITESEAKTLSEIVADGHGMDVIVIEQDELETAVDIITPQLCALGSTCFAVDAQGRAYTLFSQDDEVSFNAADKNGDFFGRLRGRAKRHDQCSSDDAFQQGLFQRPLEMLGDQSLDISNSIARELKYVHLVLRKGIL